MNFVKKLFNNYFAFNFKQSIPAPTENSGSSTPSGGSGNYGTIGRGGGTGMASMMDEMAKTLARRRAQAEKKEVSFKKLSEIKS